LELKDDRRSSPQSAVLAIVTHSMLTILNIHPVTFGNNTAVLRTARRGGAVRIVTLLVSLRETDLHSKVKDGIRNKVV
jgi:predicted transcriptional regulator